MLFRSHSGPTITEWVMDVEPKQNGRHSPKSPPPKPSTRTTAERKKRAASTSLILGDCRQKMKELKTSSVDAIICDPPYPEIAQRSKDYPKISEADWHEALMSVTHWGFFHLGRIFCPSHRPVNPLCFGIEG